MKLKKKEEQILDQNINEVFDEELSFSKLELNTLENNIFSNIDYSLLSRKKSFYFDKTKFFKISAISLASLCVITLVFISPLFLSENEVIEKPSGPQGGHGEAISRAYLTFDEFKNDIDDNYPLVNSAYNLFEVPTFDYVDHITYFIDGKEESDDIVFSSTIAFIDGNEISLIYDYKTNIIDPNNLSYIINTNFDKFDYLYSIDGDNLKALSFNDTLNNITYFILAYSSESENSIYFESFLNDLSLVFIENNY